MCFCPSNVLDLNLFDLQTLLLVIIYLRNECKPNGKAGFLTLLRSLRKSGIQVETAI